MEYADIGVAGLAVMGENIALNLESKGYSVAAYNRTPERTAAFVNGRAIGKRIFAAASIKDLAASLSRPRKILMMIKAGSPVDEFIEAATPFLEKGDILIDGGNSNYKDTARRVGERSAVGINYVGTGISGGEEGALTGPAIMPGGNPLARDHVLPILRAIAAKASDGEPCCRWIGDGGAGHFVKMVHNGIEYGDMQIICEAYHIMRSYMNMDVGEIADAFDEWNAGEINSYLIEITRDILRFKDVDGEPMVDKILDAAGQKGTGKQASIAALEEGVALTLINEAVFARYLSSQLAERKEASRVLSESEPDADCADAAITLRDVEDALLASKIVSYAQGFALINAASKTNGWGIDSGSVAMTWRGGCIIRSGFLGDISAAFMEEPELGNLLLAPRFRMTMEKTQAGWRRFAAFAAMRGCPAPAVSSALAYFDGYRRERLPANLLQAMRDYFGAHTFERVDESRGKRFHINWTGRGGATSASSYDA